jgi:hypothetical protein
MSSSLFFFPSKSMNISDVEPVPSPTLMPFFTKSSAFFAHASFELSAMSVFLPASFN